MKQITVAYYFYDPNDEGSKLMTKVILPITNCQGECLALSLNYLNETEKHIDKKLCTIGKQIAFMLNAIFDSYTILRIDDCELLYYDMNELLGDDDEDETECAVVRNED
ncbi:hypothetical protein EOM82_08350 [bacterium]|nr:hypothetical protein [bacterium]